MGEVLGVDVSNHRPVKNLSHYGEVHILNTGKVRLTEPLTNGVIAFLKTIGADVSLWDGSKGVLGRDYVSNKIPHVDLTREQIEMLRSRYHEVKLSLAESEVLDKLRNELDMNTRIQRQLSMSVFEMEQQVMKLRMQQDECEIENGEQSDAYQSIARRIGKLLGELQPCKEAASRIEKKVQQTRVDINESETGFLRRFALLTRMFACGKTVTLLEDCSEKAQLVERAHEAEEQTCKAALKLQQSKRFYVDARTGKAHLFQTENVLKSILEHLNHCMNSLQGRVDTARQIPLETGFEFRIGYVRKLWSRADICFKQALPYIKRSSLHQTRSGTTQEEAIGQQKIYKLSKQTSGSGSGAKKSGIFDSVPSILPSFTKIELSHPISRRSRVSALHKSAARAYRDMNELYDFHERMTKEAFTLLQAVECEDQQANDELIAVYEQLLGLPFVDKSLSDSCH